jgi:cell division transport system ATP-binding protein
MPEPLQPLPGTDYVIRFIEASLRHQDRIQALSEVSFAIRAGEFVFVVGATGSGKTSLLRLLNRELRATSGEVWVGGRELGQLSPDEIPLLRRQMGVVFQDFRLLPQRTLFENVAYSLRVIGVHGKTMRRRTLEALERVGVIGRSRMYPHQVSGGEQQRAALARAIVNNPALLLADEPTGNLDPETSRGIVDLLHQINRMGTTVLVATHDQAIVDALGRRVLELDAGCLVRDEARGRYEAAASGPSHAGAAGAEAAPEPHPALSGH